jgi:hypothetical protein
MRKGRVILLSLVAMFAMSAVAATASASAAEWRVGGSPLVGEKELTETTTKVANAVLTVEGVNVTVTCTGLLAQKTKIVAKTTMTAKDLQFTGCTANNNCEVTTTITTKELTATVATVGTEATELTIKPKSGETFANLVFSGTKCGLAGTQPVKGKVKATSPKGQSENKTQELVINSIGELKVGINAATMTGAATDTLVSGDDWSFH